MYLLHNFNSQKLYQCKLLTNDPVHYLYILKNINTQVTSSCVADGNAVYNDDPLYTPTEKCQCNTTRAIGIRSPFLVKCQRKLKSQTKNTIPCMTNVCLKLTSRIHPSYIFCCGCMQLLSFLQQMWK